MNILNKIIAHKNREVERRKKIISVNELMNYSYYRESRPSLKSNLINGNGIIGEYKRKSPSSGELSKKPIIDVLNLYENQGISAFSILTDFDFFGGDIKDLSEQVFRNKPLLRKDFIVDEYQIFEAKAHGASAILLIAEVLDQYHLKFFTQIAQDIGLEVLTECHDEENLQKISIKSDLIGVNNRDLKTMKTDINSALNLIRQLPYSQLKVAESGIKSYHEIELLRNTGYQGFLIGEALLNGKFFRSASKPMLL